jgi:hypothetical protein
MNMTIKASRNQENATFWENEEAAQFYFNDFVSSFITSAPLRTDGASSVNGTNNDATQKEVIRIGPISHPASYYSQSKKKIQKSEYIKTHPIGNKRNGFKSFAVRTKHVVGKK